MFSSIEITFVMNYIDRLLSWSDSRKRSGSNTRMLFSSSKEIDSLSAIQQLSHKFKRYRFKNETVFIQAYDICLGVLRHQNQSKSCFWLSQLVNQVGFNFFYRQMKDQRDEDGEYDVYFRGSKEQLFAFLYPLTGPHNSIFDHLQTQKILYDSNKKSFEVSYSPKQFENIDKQKQNIVYSSTLMPTQSNYFYSAFQPQYKSFVWQSVSNFVEMRPKNRVTLQIKEKQIVGQQQKVELDVVEYQQSNNKIRQMVEDVVVTPLKENWDVSKDEYLIHLAK